MLYWICPECGGECSPTVRECPACAGASAVSPASAGPARRNTPVTEEVLALVHNLQPAIHVDFPPVVALLSAPETNGLSNEDAHSRTIATLDLPEAREEELCRPAKETIELLVRPLIDSSTVALPSEPPPIEPATAPDTQAEPRELKVLSEALTLQTESVLDSIAEEKIAEEAAISGIVASFQKLPKISLLAPPSEELVAPAPVCLRWMHIPRRPPLPVAANELDHSNVLSGVQTPPLAGPCVPYQLRNLTDQQGGSPAHARRKPKLPAWTVSFVVALLLFLGVGTLLQRLAASHDGNSVAAPSQPSDEPRITTGAQSPSSLVEVTGLRIATGPNQRPQLEFIVVNHSAVALSNVGLRVAVRSASSQSGVAPLFRVSTTISALGPYQSREFHAELGPEVHATDVPDWQSLRADVRVDR
jgi:hypothetical protein